MPQKIKYFTTEEVFKNYFSTGKGVFRETIGNILVVGGSYLHHSPPVVAGYSLSNLGCNEVTLFVPSKHLHTVASKLMTVEVFPLPDQKITKGGVNKILKYLDKGRMHPQSAYVGAGVTGVWREVGILVYRLAKEHNIPLVLDRDAVRPPVLQHISGGLEIIMMMDKAVLNRVLESRGDIGDDIRKVWDSYSARVIFIGDGYIASYLEEEDELIGLKFEMPLKKYEYYVLASLASILLAKGIPAKYTSILAPAMYLEARGHMIRDLGALYGLEDTILYLREYLLEP
jgi:hypothetical protein